MEKEISCLKRNGARSGDLFTIFFRPYIIKMIKVMSFSINFWGLILIYKGQKMDGKKY